MYCDVERAIGEIKKEPAKEKQKSKKVELKKTAPETPSVKSTPQAKSDVPAEDVKGKKERGWFPFWRKSDSKKAAPDIKQEVKKKQRIQKKI